MSGTASSTHLNVHVRVSADKETLVFQPPFQLDEHGLASEVLDEGLWINWLDL